MIDWIISNLDLLQEILFFALAVFIFIVTLISRHSVTKAFKSFKEVFELKKNLTTDTRKNSEQKFSEYKTNYYLNKDTNELEELDTPINIQQKIDSYVECALERALKKFMPEVSAEVDDVAENLDNAVLDLSSLGEAMEVAEEYREKLNLSPALDISQIYAEVDKYAKSLKENLGKLNNKGGENNGTPQKVE